MGELGFLESDPAVRPESDVSRRALIAGALGAAFLAASQKSEAQAGSTDPASSWLKPELRLVRRTTLGLNAEFVRKAQSMGFNRYLDWQLERTWIDDSACEKIVKQRYPRISQSVTQLFNLENDWITTEQLVNATLYRSIFSQRQLFHRMVEFWSDHFNSWSGKVSGALKVTDDREVIRQFAFTTFPKLLKASAHSPAMLVYLDNDPSDKAAPSQNYARELLELHTMGVNGGYTQEDVLEVARCFTGWSYQWDGSKSNRGEFVFRSDSHDNGTKVVLGQTILPGGWKADGDKVLNMLATHPSTAQFISRKMARWLLRYDPPQSLVDSVASVYQKTGGDIKSMIRAILTQPNLMAAPAKYKRPLHMFVSVIRALNPTVQNFDHLRWSYLESAGQVPFDWAAPNGYPDAIEYWAGFILPRWRFSLDLAAGWVGGMSIDPKTILGTANTATAIVDRIDQVMFAGEILPGDKADLLAYLQSAAITNNRKRAAIGLAAASPSFQWY